MPFPKYFQLLTVRKVWFSNQLFSRMVMLLFSGIDPWDEYRECFFLGHELESSFDLLTCLVNNRWQLIDVKLVVDSSCILLPVEVFSNESLAESLRQLREEWEEIFSQR